ncbi:long-chain-fatty-acid--ligase 5 [Stylonychia lemnae]|uniref:Long-chain-fatty-acid--ligase 5 n=1 Tax=Stylonychia lemnae TaxID=5949 RepID=A0A078A2N6_STYLE|nr:long-chain-fatty-acid--ligase 5 [Stylonychia lemnae]|eukprot:CDW76486.1 long-chain-fatty-acid--ligase 5 [Stylonychia lemnae]
MGNQNTIQYARLIEGTEKPGHTAELVSVDVQDPTKLVERPADDVTTLLEAFKRSAKRAPDTNYLGTRDEKAEGRPYKWRTWSEIDEITTSYALAVKDLGMVPEIHEENQTWKFMGIYAKNREEWAITNISNFKNSVVTVAFYDTLGPQAVEFVLRQTTLTSVSSAGQYVAGLIKLKKDGKANSLQNIVSFDEVSQDIINQGEQVGIKVHKFWDVVEHGRNAKNRLSEDQLEKPKPESVYMFSYTSGTTGDPKAVVSRHSNYLSAATAASEGVKEFNQDAIFISYLPLAHSLEQALFSVALIQTCRIGYYSGDPLKLLDDMQTLKPTLFPSVPRLYSKIYDRIMAGVKEKSAAQQWIFNRAVQSKLHYLQQDGSLTHKFYDTVVFKKLRDLLGGNVNLMVTGSAPIAAEVLNTLKVIFCAPIREGYGQTETSAPATLTHPYDPVSGHVGGPIPSVKIRLRDIPEMEYLSTDQPFPRGEVCFKGPSIFTGYFKADDKTSEAFDADGWLRSGDVGLLYPNGSIKIIDRAKNIFKLSQGEYIAPEKLENVYIQSPFIAQIFVYGDSLQAYLVAIIVVEPSTLKKWAAENSLDTENLKQHLTNDALTKAILADMNKLAVENKFNSLEKIKFIHLTLEQMTQENDLLTPTMKIKRNIAKKVYDKEITELYSRPL